MFTFEAEALDLWAYNKQHAVLEVRNLDTGKDITLAIRRECHATMANACSLQCSTLELPSCCHLYTGSLYAEAALLPPPAACCLPAQRFEFWSTGG